MVVVLVVVFLGAFMSEEVDVADDLHIILSQ